MPPILPWWLVTSLSLFGLKMLTLVNPSKVNLWDRRVGLPHLLGKILTYENLIYLLNFLFYCVNISPLTIARITTKRMVGSLLEGKVLQGEISHK